MRSEAIVEEEVDPRLAVVGEPIVGMEHFTWEEGKGPSCEGFAITKGDVIR